MKNTKATESALEKAAQKYLNSQGAKKYLNYDGMEARYLVNRRTIQRRVIDGLLPQPKFFGSKHPRWDLDELDASDRKLASVRLANAAVIAAAKANAIKSAERKAAKKKAPAPAEKPRKHAAAVEQHEEISF
jgi:hypothetical protein